MEKIISEVLLLVGNLPLILQALLAAVGVLSSLCTALAAVFLLVPGPQPEASLKKVAEKLEKFSKK